MMEWLRVCARCSYSVPPIDFMCERCWDLLARRIFTANEKPEAPFEVRFLWLWGADDESVAELIYKLKRAQLPKAHRRMAQWLLQIQEMNFPELIVFPSKNPNAKDHAFFLAQAFSETLGVPAEPLVIEGSADYRNMSRGERYRFRRIQKRAKSPERVLFVDDVYTTGATAFGAWYSLGKPKGFQAAVLAYKRLERLQRQGVEKIIR